VTETNADRQLEIAIGWILRVGILLSSLCLTLGLALVLGDAGSDAARLLLAAGTIVLIATPVARVLVSVIEYARQRDWVFVALTLVVLAELVAALVVARRGASR
jgi:uncharacterized membrane protein